MPRCCADFPGQQRCAEPLCQGLMADAGSPRAVEAYGRFLERQGRVAEAAILHWMLANARARARWRLPAWRASAKGETRRLSQRRGGAAEALFGIAASLSERRAPISPFSICSMALSLRPEIRWPISCSPTAMRASRKFDEAIAIYRKRELGFALWLDAQVQIAVDENRT